MAPLLDVRGLSVDLPTESGFIRPVNDVSFALDAGETLGLVGESGSGKTMLALALIGLLPTGARTAGHAFLPPRDLNGAARDLVQLTTKEKIAVRGAEIGMIFQEPMTALDPVMRIGTQIEEAIRAHHPSMGSDEIKRRATEAMQRAAIPDPPTRAKQFPHRLSGGLRQRAMIAMALAAGPRLLIADEPTTALDVTVQKQILELLRNLQRELGLGLIFVTHDLAVVGEIAARVAVMYAGRIVEIGVAEEVLRRPRHPYTEGLLRASPQLRRRNLEPIGGNVPRLDDMPPGCAFEPRCPLRRPACAEAVPDLRAAAPGHRARCILVEEIPEEVAR